MSKRIPRKVFMQRTSTETDSEFGISTQKGIQAKGPIAWAVLICFLIVALFYIKVRYGDAIKVKLVATNKKLKS